MRSSTSTMMTEKRSPAELLALAIVAQACHDARLPGQYHAAHDARRWINGLMFEEVCRVADIRPEQVRNRLRKEGAL